MKKNQPLKLCYTLLTITSWVNKNICPWSRSPQTALKRRALSRSGRVPAWRRTRIDQNRVLHLGSSWTAGTSPPRYLKLWQRGSGLGSVLVPLQVTLTSEAQSKPLSSWYWHKDRLSPQHLSVFPGFVEHSLRREHGAMYEMFWCRFLVVI